LSILLWGSGIERCFVVNSKAGASAHARANAENKRTFMWREETSL